ncbi:MAG: hypothetical protein ACN2B6_00305 [Rickettsiales bacterium]
MTAWVNKIYVIHGDEFEIDLDTHNKLNQLAAAFYSRHGHRVMPGHDFSEARHPEEKLMYALALEAYTFNIKFGLD